MLRRILLVVLLTIAFATLATAQTAGLKSYYNREYKVGLKYPTNWKLTKQNDDGKDVHLAWFDPPKASLRGQLRKASVGLWVSATKFDEAECLSFRDESTKWEQANPVAKKVGTLTFYQKTASDGDVDTGRNASYYRIFHGGKCYNLMFDTFEVNAPEDDRYVKTVKQQFDAILHSLYFGK